MFAQSMVAKLMISNIVLRCLVNVLAPAASALARLYRAFSVARFVMLHNAMSVPGLMDTPIVPTDVCFKATGGDRAGLPRCWLTTDFGHAPATR